MKKIQLLSVVVLAGYFLIPQARAATACTAMTGNLVANCGFEAGTFSGWTLTGTDVPLQEGTLYGVEGTDPVNSIAPHSGKDQAYFADLTTSPLTLSQSIATVAGTAYKISFYAAQDTDPNSGGSTYTNSLSASFGGASLISSAVVPVEGYTLYSFTGVAGSSASVLSLTFGNDLGQFLVDDVTVTATPEPAAWVLVAGGAVMALSLARKRIPGSGQY